jgi:hypothetical protein
MTTPYLDTRTMATRRTARASHGAALAVLASSAAGDYLGQRATIARTTGGTHDLFWWSRDGVAYLRVRALLGQEGSYTTTHYATLALSITDGTTTIAATDPEIPVDLDGVTTHYLSGAFPGPRWSRTSPHEWYLSVEDLVTAGLVVGGVWRLQLIAVCDATIAVEHFAVSEVPRFVVDTGAPFGQSPGAYLPRSAIQSAVLRRALETAQWAYDEVLGTYHHLSRPHASPLTTTSAAFAALTGDEVGAGTGVARPWYCYPRTTGYPCRVRWRVRYKTSGASGGKIRLVTTDAGSPFVLTLAGTSGVWTDSADGTGYLTPGARDTLSFTAQVDGGTLSIATRAVVDYPE